MWHAACGHDVYLYLDSGRAVNFVLSFLLCVSSAAADRFHLQLTVHLHLMSAWPGFLSFCATFHVYTKFRPLNHLSISLFFFVFFFIDHPTSQVDSSLVKSQSIQIEFESQYLPQLESRRDL